MIMSVITMNLITLTVIITTSKLHTIQKSEGYHHHVNHRQQSGGTFKRESVATSSFSKSFLPRPCGLQNWSRGGSHQIYSSGMAGMIVSKALNFSIIFTNIGKVAAILQAPYWKNSQLRNQMERSITRRYVSTHLPAARRLLSASLVVICRNSDEIPINSRSFPSNSDFLMSAFVS